MHILTFIFRIQTYIYMELYHYQFNRFHMILIEIVQDFFGL